MRYCLIAMTSIGGWLAESWALMIAIGVVHSEWLPGLPTISYESALRVSLAVTLLTTAIAVPVLHHVRVSLRRGTWWHTRRPR